MNKRDLGYWTLPKPDVDIKEWTRIPRVARTIPFGYREDPEDKDYLLPIQEELDALEQAKKHLIQYSYREVANWLSKETGRTITHMGLKKRIEVERKRKKSVKIKRELTRRLEKAIKEISKLEEERTGSYVT
tara:strand:+ start:1981 stop:2376 length:396 start_codon:yes stop_codon:yes gene_type:complete